MLTRIHQRTAHMHVKIIRQGIHDTHLKNVLIIIIILTGQHRSHEEEGNSSTSRKKVEVEAAPPTGGRCLPSSSLFGVVVLSPLPLWVVPLSSLLQWSAAGCRVLLWYGCCFHLLRCGWCRFPPCFWCGAEEKAACGAEHSLLIAIYNRKSLVVSVERVLNSLVVTGRQAVSVP